MNRLWTAVLIGTLLSAACAPAATPSPTQPPAKAAATAPPAAAQPAATAAPAAKPATAAAPASQPAPAAAASPAAAAKASPGQFQEVLQAARQEVASGTFTIWALGPRDEKTHQALFEAFRKKYNLTELKAEWLPIHPNDGTPRIIAEAQAGKVGPSNAFGSVGNLGEIDRAGLIETVDWVGIFGQEYPGIKEPAIDRMPQHLQGKGIVLYDATRTFIFNTDQVKIDEVPNDLEGLADPKWSRKFVMDGGGSSPWDLLAIGWGEERTINTLKKLVANRPIYKNGAPAVNNAVAAGEGAIGLGSIHNTMELKAKGAPVDWKPFGEYVPALTLGYAVLKNSPQPNLTKLFLAWLTMEGVAIAEEMEYISRVTLETSLTNRLIKERAPNAKVLAPTNQQELQVYESMRDKVEPIVTAGGQ